CRLPANPLNVWRVGSFHTSGYNRIVCSLSKSNGQLGHSTARLLQRPDCCTALVWLEQIHLGIHVDGRVRVVGKRLEDRGIESMCLRRRVLPSDGRPVVSCSTEHAAL